MICLGAETSIVAALYSNIRIANKQITAQSVKNLKEKLVCAVCKNTLKNPKLLACFHAFCVECLKQGDQIEVFSSELKFPTACSKVMDLPEEGVAGLKWNPLVCRLHKVLEAKKNASQIMCDACGNSKSPLTTYCRDCLSFICDSCASYHGKMKLLLKDHHTVPLDKIINGTFQINWMEEGLWRKAHECGEHIGELRRFYCRTCKKRICRDCIVLDHTKPDHDCTTMQKLFQESKEKLNDRLTSCKEKEEHATSRSESDSETKGKHTTPSVTNVNTSSVSLVRGGNSNKRPVAAGGGGFTFGLTLPQHQHGFAGISPISQTVSSFDKSPSKAENEISPSASKGKDTRQRITKKGSSIFTSSMILYRGKPRRSPTFGFGGTPVNQGSQLSSDSCKVPLDRVQSLAAAKTGQLVFLRWDKKAVVITDKDGGVQLEIKEPGRMYLSISCTESDALYVLSAFWGSHIVTLAKHSLEDGGPLEKIIDELDVSADFQSDEWPVIGNYGNDLVIMHTGKVIRVYSAEAWDILDDDKKDDV
eukprot:XP_011668123.1 PREDICTED: uncharacterized protein LOC100891252 isoform X2 [Strongylocentrotus purpuratus]